MLCHYEVLKVERDAEDEEIKRAYKKLALQCHPDKNPDRIEECTKEFHRIQEAYQILTDPHERAWYDKYRSSILRGGQGGGNKAEDDLINVYPFLSTSCYKKKDDSIDGFYTVYRELFESIAVQDLGYLEEDDDDIIIPGFGDSNSNFDDTVRQFYSYWDTYITLKTFDCYDEYDLRQAGSRYERRIMESENRKIREKEKKEYNNIIRCLVAFVKKRDKRLEVHRIKLQKRENEVKKLTQEKKEKHIRERAKQLLDYNEQHWNSNSRVEDDLKKLEHNITSEFADHSDVELESDDENYYKDFMCVACNKVFKSEKAFVNHENSKKHKENIEIMKNQMLLEDNQNEFDDELMSRLGANDSSNNHNKPSCEEKVKQSKKSKKRDKQRKKEQDKLEELAEKLKLEEQKIIENEKANAEKLKNLIIKSPKEKVNKLSSDDDDDDDDDRHEVSDKKIELICRICSKSFNSRNSLFKHVKISGHAIHQDFCDKPQPKVDPNFGAKRSKNKNKKHQEII